MSGRVAVLMIGAASPDVLAYLDRHGTSKGPTGRVGARQASEESVSGW